MSLMTRALAVLCLSLVPVLCPGAINPFEFQKTASTCAVATLVDFKASEDEEHTQLRYEVKVDDIIWDNSGLQPGDTLIIRYHQFNRKKPGFWEKLFGREPMPGPQELYDPELSFFENDQAVLFLEKVEIDGEVFYTPASNQYSSEHPGSAESLKEFHANRS